MATKISSYLGLRVGTDRTDYGGSQVPRPGTKDMAHAAGGRVDQDKISRLHLMRSMQEILRGHPLQDQSCQLNVIQRQVLGNPDQVVGWVKAFLSVRPERRKAGANPFADGEPGDAGTQLLDLGDPFEAEDKRRIARGHRVRNTCPVIRIGEIHADGHRTETHLATPGRADLDVFPHEVVGWALPVNYRCHSHAAYSCCDVRGCLGRTVRSTPNCLPLISFGSMIG